MCDEGLVAEIESGTYADRDTWQVFEPTINRSGFIKEEHVTATK